MRLTASTFPRTARPGKGRQSQPVTASLEKERWKHVHLHARGGRWWARRFAPLPFYALVRCRLICLRRKRRSCARPATKQHDGQITSDFQHVSGLAERNPPSSTRAGRYGASIDGFRFALPIPLSLEHANSLAKHNPLVRGRVVAAMGYARLIHLAPTH